ncbi:hypothetical protein KEM56_006488 [Ascosphaera pollenicola]|nr:hypothetical protein KEM56_006488 [Ascosphaera pollenicola]
MADKTDDENKSTGAKAWIEKHLLPDKHIAMSSEEYLNRYKSQSPKASGGFGCVVSAGSPCTTKWRPGKGDSKTISVPYEK